jgi:hypothetical protein
MTRPPCAMLSGWPRRRSSGQAAAEQAAGRLADRLGVKTTWTPGTHFPYLDHPQQLAQRIRPFLRELSGDTA